MRIFTLLLFFAILQPAAAQQPLADARKGSHLTYIYQLNAAEASTLYGEYFDTLQPRFLHTLKDSFQKTRPPLPSGNYLLLRAIKNQLQYELVAVGDVQLKPVNNSHDLVLALHSKQGDLITNGTVQLNGKPLPYDVATQTFRKAKHKRGGQVLVEHGGVIYPFTIEPMREYGRKRTFWQTIGASFPLRYVVRPFQKWFGKKPYRNNNFWYRTQYEQDYRGFMVFGKPMYKPGDTVRVKAFVTTGRGKPLADVLNLRLSSRYFDVDTVLSPIAPYRNGGYEYSFVLTDSLDLDLDEDYLLTLEKRGRNVSLADYDGDEEEDEIAAKRKVVMRGQFRYEEYELNSVTLAARTNKRKHHRGEELAVFVKATDENGLAVMDGRLQLIVRPNPYDYSTKTFGAPKVFLPDTLWQYEGPLDAVGETKVVLPDSLFPQASFNYSVECVFLNSNNERQTENISASFNHTRDWIDVTQPDDSLKLEAFKNARPLPLAAMLFAINSKGDTIINQRINLPASLRVHPLVKTYRVVSDSLLVVHQVEGLTAPSAIGYRTADSVYIRLHNPYRLPVWYSVFAGNKVVLRGYGDTLFYAAKSITAKYYFVSLQYITADAVQSHDYTIPYQDKLLKLAVEQPITVYPGQTTSTTITVTDVMNKPVAGADLTAWSFTKKFPNAGTPNIPYFGKYYPGRKRFTRFEEKPATYAFYDRLVWQRWAAALHLDTMEYYRFLRTQSIYTATQPAPDSATQLAPFVTLNGELQPVHLIYIDEVPTFFSSTQHLRRFTFPVSPGKHTVRLRTHNKLITLDSFAVAKGVKTIISLNADTANRRIRVQQMPDTLTAYEQTLWDKYLLLIEDTWGERYASVSSGDKLFLLNSNSSPVLTGPFPYGYANLTVKNGFTQGFETEGRYSYRITQGLIKQKQLPYNYQLYHRLSAMPPSEDFQHYALTAKEIDSLWQRYLYNRSASEDLFRNAQLMKDGNGRLQIGLPKDSSSAEPFVRNLFLFRYDDPDFLRIYKGQSRDLGYLQPGNYRLLVLLPGDRYAVVDSIRIKKDGINYYNIQTLSIKTRDSVSLRIADILAQRQKAWLNSGNTVDAESIKQSFNQRYLDASLLTETVSGVVVDEKGNPVAGASVALKGAITVATLTDVTGRFQLRTTPNAVVVISSVGYMPQELRLTEGWQAITLTAAKQMLNEVVVIGYGMQRRSELTGSVSTVSGDNYLMGRVAGLTIGSPGSMEAIQIRGIGSLAGSAAPLIIVDGVPFDGNLEKLDPSLIADVTTLKDAAATALYGARAAGGVIVITTKKAADAQAAESAGNSLRRRFRDDAYWQPKLTTNAQGQASFNVTWPDDITAWRTFAAAVTDNKQSGFTEGAVRSFRPVSAVLALPLFSVEGDTIKAIGKAMNYGTDSLRLKRSFAVNNAVVKESTIAFKNAWIDTFTVVGSGADSLRFKYTVQKETGYFDGEERIIPTFKKGVLQTDGFFAPLRGDTSFMLQPLSDTGHVTLYAESSVLPVLEQEVQALHRYEYLCNEQLASKLKGWLVQKRIDSLLKRPFKGDGYVREIISKLTQSRATSGLWGWWAGNETKLWISLHVMEALLQASAQGYTTPFEKGNGRQVLINYLVSDLENYQGTEQLSAIHLLQLLNAKVDYKKYTDSVSVYKVSLYEKLRLAEAKQRAGLPFTLDSLLLKQSRTMMGNIYWGEENSYRFFDNSIQNSLLMYRLLKAQGGQEEKLEALRGYFLERRRKGSWSNTYESSLVLETLLPDLLVNDSLPTAGTLTVNGSAINRFPYRAEVSTSTLVSITKTGRLPIYFTAYQQHWNAAPTAVSGDFAVTTSFVQSGNAVQVLTAGEPAEMKLTVTVNADAEYVLVEAPIPAGCSYNDKRQTRSNNEVHREYFKNKVSIFCSRLPKGEYVFTVSLLPRYSGSYTLNPARAECMYFPVLYGREAMKKLKVN